MTPGQLPLRLEEPGVIALPQGLEPVRIRRVARPFDAAGYLFESRWKGIRVLAAIERGKVSVRNRRLGELASRFPEAQLLRDAAVEQPLLVEGELVVLDARGRPDFDVLQHRLRLLDESLIDRESRERPACFLAVDILFRGQRWLLGEPLSRRKRLLAEALHASDFLYLSEPFEDEGRALFQATLDSDLEGIVAKPVASPYTPGTHGGGWLTVGKGSEELVVGGFNVFPGGGASEAELLLGSFDDTGRLTFVMTALPPPAEEARKELFAVLNAFQIDESPFGQPLPYLANWVRPEVVVTVDSEQREGSGAAVIQRVRLDVAPDECMLPIDAPSIATVTPNSRPKLTLLSTLPLPFQDGSAASGARPVLRILGGED